MSFDSGSLDAPITDHVGATVASEFAQTGDYGCRLKPVSANGNVASLVIGKTGFRRHRRWATFSMSFRLVTRPRQSDKYMNLFEIGNTATGSTKSQFTVYFNHDKLVCDFNSSELMEITAVPLVGTWHTISVMVNYGSTKYVARVKYDDGAVKKLVSKNNKTSEFVKALWIHYPTVPVDYTMDINEVRMMTSNSEPKFLPVF